MPRGGRRTGTPGRSYPNRVDLSTVKPPMVAAPGQAYGEAGAQLEAQRAVPMGPPPLPDLPPFSRSTERPDEPVTAGLPVGPGPGPEVLAGFENTNESFLRGVYRRFPSEELRELLEELDGGPF